MPRPHINSLLQALVNKLSVNFRHIVVILCLNNAPIKDFEKKLFTSEHNRLNKIGKYNVKIQLSPLTSHCTSHEYPSSEPYHKYYKP